MLCGKSVSISKAAEKLLKYVQNNDILSIENLIKRHQDLLTYEYHHPYDSQTILIIACNDFHSMKNVKGTTIEKLIELGANYTEFSKNDYWEPIHYVALHANKEKLVSVLKFLTTQEVNSLVHCSKHIVTKYSFCSKTVPKSYSNNALSVLLKYGNRENNVYDCCKLLIEAGVNINQTDSNGISPMDLLESMDDIDFKVFLKQQSNINQKAIFEYVKLNKEEQFLKLDIIHEGIDSVDGVEEKHSSCTLLQLCCTKGLTSCIKRLLENGASPNKIIPKNQNAPIMIAIKEDNEEVVRLLLASPYLMLPTDILIKLQIKYKHAEDFSTIDKYMALILKYLRSVDNNSIKKFLLSKDDLNRTALHYAVHYRCSENILDLLLMGASLNNKDVLGYTPMDSIEPSLLEKYFDNCIDIPKNGEDMNKMLYSLQSKKQRFSVEINYESLITESGDDETHESQFLYHMIKSKNLSHLLNHPVISSYLAVKWQRFKWAVYINLFLYFMAYAWLLFYGFGNVSVKEASNSLLLTSLLLLLLREFVQILIFRWSYLKRLDNIIDLFLITGIIYILASGWMQSLENQNLLVAFSIVFLTSTLGIFMQLGNLQVFTIKVIILKQITINFCKYMVFYLFPILGFFFCFYMLSEVKEDLFFEILYKTITMFVGDPDSDYPQQFTTNPIFSHIIYVVFIALIGIVLQNLLIGLAVNDLQDIQKEAEFIDKKERARYITNIERVIFQHYHQSSTWIFKKLFKKLLEMSHVFQSERVLTIEPYNSGCVYAKETPARKNYIDDQNILNLLQNIIKDLTLKHDSTNERYSLKALYDKLSKIEYLLQNVNITVSKS